MDLSESKDFLVHTASLKEVRVFSREVFEKLKIKNDLKEELVLAIAEAAQNIVKHAYKGVENTTDHMQIKISLKDDNLEIGFNSKYLLDIASQIQGKEIEILLSDSASPALITDPDQEGVIFVLMPMRV